jgi:hypothetical protein
MPTVSTRRGRRVFVERTNLLTSLLLVFPLFLVYEVGVLALPEVHNGADLITSELLALLHGQVGTYILVNLGLGAAFLGLVLILRRKNSFDTGLFLPVIVESTVYALTMGSLILFVMQDILHVDPRLATTGPPPVGFLGKIVLSLGAGVHEELVFRLMMVSGLLALGERLLGLRRWVAVAMAFAVSSLLFSAAHHVVGGEPWALGVFTYRVLCGVVFATLFQLRGFAVAVYTHAIYDVFVLLFH